MVIVCGGFVLGGNCRRPSPGYERGGYHPVTGVNTQVIQTLINNGDDTFRAVSALADIHGHAVALADLNGDVIPDLVCHSVTGASSDLDICRRDGARRSARPCNDAPLCRRLLVTVVAPPTCVTDFRP